MGKIIGKVIATEKNPSTIDFFYFWTKTDLILNPFDVVKIDHLCESVSYGVVEEISHITDTANFLSDYISSDFGDVLSDERTQRIGMNYVKASIVSNTKNIYTPLLNDAKVELANKNEVEEALGLKNVKSPITCGYLQMYNNEEDRVTLPVQIDSRFLIGPEGAQLNISGISGLAAKTSYAMFLLKAIQDKSIKEKDDIAFVFFNVKGKDLLAIDQNNDFDSEEEKRSVLKLYKDLKLSTEPFKDVHYYYPYSDKKIENTYLTLEEYNDQKELGNALLYKYACEDDMKKLDMLFASIDDPNQTMDAIINYIVNEQGGFKGIDNWEEFLSEVKKYCSASTISDKEISVLSWRKFNRIIRNSIYKNPIFGCIRDTSEETRLEDALKHIKKNQVYVIDIAKLNEDMQGFVFGDVIRTVYNLQLGQYSEDEDIEAPKKIIIFVDELNKYASQDTPKSSPILQQVLDIAERGRSLGIILFAAEQFRSSIHSRVTGNCSTHAYGRTNAIEIAKSDYRFVPSVYKNMLTRLQQGEYIIQNPIFRSLLNIKFPKPIYKQYKQ